MFIHQLVERAFRDNKISNCQSIYLSLFLSLSLSLSLFLSLFDSIIKKEKEVNSFYNTVMKHMKKHSFVLFFLPQTTGCG